MACALPSLVSAQSPCAGDCDGNGRITPSEVDMSAEALFEPAALASCRPADIDASGVVTAAELLRVVRDSTDLSSGCAGGGPPATTTPTTTPTPTPTPTTAAATSLWIPLAPLADGPRQEIGVAAAGDLIYVAGGLDEDGLVVPRVEAYDVTTDTWTTVASLPRALHHTGAGTAAGQVYSIGGLSGAFFTPVTDVFRYDAADNGWDSVAPLPTARGALAVAQYDGKLYAAGGSGPAGSVTRHDVYDPSANTWTQLADLPTPRNHLAAATIDERIYVVGGRESSATNSSAELDRYDPATDTWTVLASMPTGRSGIAAAAVHGQLAVIGGEANPQHPRGVFPQVEVYNPVTNTWRSLDPMPVPRHGIGAVTVGELIYVPGGATRAGFEATAYHDALQIVD